MRNAVLRENSFVDDCSTTRETERVIPAAAQNTESAADRETGTSRRRPVRRLGRLCSVLPRPDGNQAGQRQGKLLYRQAVRVRRTLLRKDWK